MIYTIIVTGIVLMFSVILWFLCKSLYYFFKDNGKTTKTVKALSFRIGYSWILFISLFVLAQLGLITPHGIS